MTKKIKTILIICLILLPVLLSFIFIDFSPKNAPTFRQESEIQTPELDASAASGYWTSYYAVPYGSGTEEDPYLIATDENLAWMSYYTKNIGDLYGHFKQIANIDLGAHYWIPIGFDKSGVMYNWFYGNYDGCGFYVKNMSYPKTSSSTSFANTCGESYGLFGFVAHATIKNVRLLNIVENGPCRARHLGSIVGLQFDDSVVENCLSFASLNHEWDGYYSSNIGGIVGSSSGGKISNCYYESDYIKHKSTGTIDDWECGVGGIVGGGGTPINCYVNCKNISAQSSRIVFVGGLVAQGYTGGSIVYKVSNCFFKGKITEIGSNVRSGAIAGCVASSSILENCYVKAQTNKEILYASDYYGLADSNVGYGGILNACIFEIQSETDSDYVKQCNKETSYSDYSNWIKTFDGRLMPSGLSWMATAGVKLTGIEEVEEMGYTAV